MAQTWERGWMPKMETHTLIFIYFLFFVPLCVCICHELALHGAVHWERRSVNHRCFCCSATLWLLQSQETGRHTARQQFIHMSLCVSAWHRSTWLRNRCQGCIAECTHGPLRNTNRKVAEGPENFSLWCLSIHLKWNGIWRILCVFFN